MEKVKLSNYARRADLYTKFMNTNPAQASEIESAKEKSDSEGQRCNFPVIICELEGTIPGTTPKKVNAKYYTDLEEKGKWIDKYLTSASYEYKNISKVVSSETSKYKVQKYFNYLPQTVLNAAGKHQADYITSYCGIYNSLAAEHIAVSWILFKCNFDVRDNLLCAITLKSNQRKKLHIF